MADTTKVNPIGGGMGFFSDLNFEVESPLRSVTQGVGGILQGVLSLGQEIAGAGKFSSGSIEFSTRNQAQDPELLKKQQQAVNNKIFFRNLEEMRDNTQRFAHERALEDIIRLEIAGEPTEEKNRDLHLSLDLDEKNTQTAYHMQALRDKKRERLLQAEVQAKETNIAETKASPFMGEGELLKGGENFQHWTKAIG